MLQAPRDSPEGVLKRDVNLKLINSYSLHLALLSPDDDCLRARQSSAAAAAALLSCSTPECSRQSRKKDDTDNRHMNDIKIKLIMHEVHKKDDGK